MKHVFEEYGKLILSIIVAAVVVGIIFTGVGLLGALGEKVDIETELSHSKSEAALKTVSERTKPEVSVVDSESLHIQKNKAFQPLKAVECLDADGNPVEPVVTSVVLVSYMVDETTGEFVLDEEGNKVQEKTELIDYYNTADDLILLNKEHYNDTHSNCTVSEFDGEDMSIVGEEGYNTPGVAVVTYRATDSYNVFSIKTISFVIDNK